MTKILCIEDEPMVLEDLVEELEDRGYEVLSAKNGVDGLAMILKHEPELVISDITMPGMGGHELLAELRTKHNRFDNMPFLFLSALADDKEIVEGLKRGAYNYMTKPVDFKLLGLTVEASLDHVRSVQA